MLTYIAIIFSAILVNNIVFAQFLGICPFIGVSKNIDSAFGMSMAVAFVMAMATAVTWLLQHYVLEPFGIVYLQTIAFILVIAILVQMLEIIMKKSAPGLYVALGVYLPLITTNCAVLGTAIIAANKNFDFLYSIVYAVSTALGFGLAHSAVCRHTLTARTRRCATFDAWSAHCLNRCRNPCHGVYGILRY